MRAFLRVLILCLPLLTIPAMPVHAAASPIFPPASVFVFPTSIVGGTTQIAPPSVTEHPAKAVADVFYSISAQHNLAPLINYFVDTFRSSSDVQQYDTHQRASVAADGRYHLLRIVQPVAPGEWLAVSPRYKYVEVQASLVYRNIELSATNGADYSPTSLTQQRQATQQIVQSVLTMEARLLSRAQAFAAHPVNLSAPTLPIFPPDSVFVLPTSVAGAKVTVTTATSSNNQPPTNAVAQAHYQFSHQHIAFEYYVTTFHSVQDATAYFKSTYKGMDNGATLVRISHPAIPGEFLLEYDSVGGGMDGGINAGFAYRNLFVLTAALVSYSTGPGQLPTTPTRLMSGARLVACQANFEQ